MPNLLMLFVLILFTTVYLNFRILNLRYTFSFAWDRYNGSHCLFEFYYAWDLWGISLRSGCVEPATHFILYCLWSLDRLLQIS